MKKLSNYVQLIGHLGSDPEVKTFDNGYKRVQLKLATNELFKTNEGDSKIMTNWHNLVVWGKLAEICQKYLKKGGQIAVDGRVNYRTYIDKNANVKVITEIIVSDLLMLSGRQVG